MKSPVYKIPYQDLGLIQIEPLTASEPMSVPPLDSRALVSGSSAVLNSVRPMAPEVRDATSVAASLTAWQGDPSNQVELSDTVLWIPSGPPDLDIPLELEESAVPHEVFNIVRDCYPCFHDSEYSALSNQFKLHNLQTRKDIKRSAQQMAHGSH